MNVKNAGKKERKKERKYEIMNLRIKERVCLWNNATWDSFFTSKITSTFEVTLFKQSI